MCLYAFGYNLSLKGEFMKKVIIFISIVLLLCGCSPKTPEEQKNEEYEQKMKESFISAYEDINNRFREVKIDKDHPFIRIDMVEAMSKLQVYKSTYIYFGDEKCPWCRSCIESAIKIAKKNGIDKVYYVEMWTKENDELYRDTLSYAGEVLVHVIKGEEIYFKMLNFLDDYLEDYVIDGKNTGEKRIYMPFFVHFTNGVPDRAITGVSDKQEDANGELTQEIIKEQEKMFDEFFKEKACGREC